MVKIGYLTIDDAPSEDTKEKIDFLLKHKIPAIFFCEGQRLEKYPEAAIYAIKKGFVLGNHAYNHPHFSEIAMKKCFEQIKKTDELLEQIYKKAGVTRPAKVFRFPYIDKGWGDETSDQGWPSNEKQRKHAQAIQDYLKKLGYKQPKFKGITYKWYLNAKLLDDIDVAPTYDTCDYAPLMKVSTYGIKDLKGVLARMDEDLPEACRGINYPDSNEIIMTHDHPFGNEKDHGKAEYEKFRKLAKEIFFAVINRLLEKGIKFELPEF